MKKIAISINTSWNVFNFRLGLCKELQKKGFEIIIIAPTDEYSQKLVEMGFVHYDIKINNKGTNPIQDAYLTYKYFRMYLKIKPDVVLHFTIKPDIYASLAAGILRIPIVTNITGLGSLFIHPTFALKIAKLLYTIALKLPKKVFFQNLEDMNAFIHEKIVSYDKADILPGSGIDLEKFTPMPDTNTKKKESFKFLMVSRLLKDKGVIEYVEAARNLRSNYIHVEFQLLGALYEGNPTSVSSATLLSWIKEGVISYFEPTDAVKEYINEADCVVLPSYREGMSRTLLEAASMAKPLIATKVPGCLEIVDHGLNGYLCNVADSKDLARKMEKMLNLNPKELKIMGEKSREKMEKSFDEHIVIDKYLAAIETYVK